MNQAHFLAQKIIKFFIDEKIPINEQLKIIKNVKQRLDFSKNTSNDMKQIKDYE